MPMPFLLWWHWLPIVCAAMNEIILHDLRQRPEKPPNRARAARVPSPGS